MFLEIRRRFARIPLDIVGHYLLLTVYAHLCILSNVAAPRRPGTFAIFEGLMLFAVQASRGGPVARPSRVRIALRRRQILVAGEFLGCCKSDGFGKRVALRVALFFEASSMLSAAV